MMPQMMMYPPQMPQMPQQMMPANQLQAGYTNMPAMPVDLNSVPMNTVIQTANGPMIMTPGGLVPYQQMQQNFGNQMSGQYPSYPYGRGI